MAINELPCGQCKNYDPILGPNERETRRGWCIPRSVYPFKEGPGQVFPVGVKHVAKGQLAQPYVVKKDYVHPTCEYVRATTVNQVDEKKKQQLARITGKDGRVVHS